MERDSTIMDINNDKEIALFWKNKYFELQRDLAAAKISEQNKRANNPEAAAALLQTPSTNPFLPPNGSFVDSYNSLSVGIDNSVGHSNDFHNNKNTSGSSDVPKASSYSSNNPFLNELISSNNNQVPTSIVYTDNNHQNSTGGVPQYTYSTFMPVPIEFPAANGPTIFHHHPMVNSNFPNFPRINENENSENGFRKKVVINKKQYIKNNERRAKGGHKHNSKSKRTAIVAKILNNMIEDLDNSQNDDINKHETPKKYYPKRKNYPTNHGSNNQSAFNVASPIPGWIYYGAPQTTPYGDHRPHLQPQTTNSSKTMCNHQQKIPATVTSATNNFGQNPNSSNANITEYSTRDTIEIHP